MEGDPFAEENVLLRGTANGRFEEVLPRGGVGSPLVETSRSAAFGDIDGDGDVDILIHNRDAGVHLLRNEAAGARRAITFEVVNEHGAPAIGAAVFTRVPGRDAGEVRHGIRTAESYGAASSPLVHVSAGDGSAPLSFRVVWSDGTEGESGTAKAGERVRVRRQP